MKYELILSSQASEASEEYEEAFEFYRNKSPQLGSRFSEELLDFLERIEAHPTHFQIADSTYRRAHLKIFPYTIFYKILDQQQLIEVVAIWPQVARPDGWKK